jgi:hypothetical protein
MAIYRGKKRSRHIVHIATLVLFTHDLLQTFRNYAHDNTFVC